MTIKTVKNNIAQKKNQDILNIFGNYDNIMFYK